MKQFGSSTARIALGVAVFAAASGAAFAAWANQADGIFLSMIEAGMSWCF